MKGTERRLHRLQLETMDWCRGQSKASDDALTLHRETIQWRPEVWDDA